MGKVAFAYFSPGDPYFQILTAGTKPSAPAWGGIGDFDVVKTEEIENENSCRFYTFKQVWDWQKQRWFMLGSFFRMAISTDKGGARGWKR